jgi:hypothetical protein
MIQIPKQKKLARGQKKNRALFGELHSPLITIQVK